MKNFLFLFIFFYLLLPVSFVSAQSCYFDVAIGTYSPPGCNSSSGVVGVAHKIQDIFNSVIPVLISLGVVYFVWGVVQYVIGDGEEAKKKGRDSIIFGIIGLAVIMSVWGLVVLLTDTFIVDTGSSGAPTSNQIKTLLPQ